MRVPTTSRRHSIQFNMTPMIDVVFLLIIFFLVSSHLARQETQLDLLLPSAESGEELSDSDKPRVTVNVTAQGQLLLGSAKVNASELEARLRYERGHSGETLEVRIRGDRTVPYQFVEPILLAAARAGIWNVALSVVREENGSNR